MPRPVATPIRGHPWPNPPRAGNPSLSATARALGLPTESLIAYLQANGGLPEGSATFGVLLMRGVESQT